MESFINTNSSFSCLNDFSNINFCAPDVDMDFALEKKNLNSVKTDKKDDCEMVSIFGFLLKRSLYNFIKKIVIITILILIIGFGVYIFDFGIVWTWFQFKTKKIDENILNKE